MNVRFSEIEIGQEFKWRTMHFKKTETSYAIRDRNSYLFNGAEICQIDRAQGGNVAPNATQQTPASDSQTQAFARRFWTYSDVDED